MYLKALHFPYSDKETFSKFDVNGEINDNTRIKNRKQKQNKSIYEIMK